MNHVSEQTFLVTGGANGLGFLISQELRNRGHSVIVWDRAATDHEGDALVSVDVRDPDEVALAAESLPSLLHGVVTCAGVASRESILELTPSEWSHVIDVNLHGTFHVAQACFSRLRETRGTLITLGSVAGSLAISNRSAYCASKAAVAMLMRCLALEWGPHGVRAVSLAPGFTDAGMSAQGIDSGGTDADSVRQRTPLREFVPATQVATLAADILEKRWSAITGTEIVIDGGLSTGWP